MQPTSNLFGKILTGIGVAVLAYAAFQASIVTALDPATHAQMVAVIKEIGVWLTAVGAAVTVAIHFLNTDAQNTQTKLEIAKLQAGQPKP